ncbi:MAG TPA: DUF2272 domain-containing protein [Terricaulis sp.]|nr:DUF2272 domain-containing protein [Terricaulis sp.]
MLRVVLSAAALFAAPAYAQSGDPLARGVLSFEAHENGLQYPRYEAAPAQACAAAPMSGLRQRLIDLAVQEWARFGYPIARRAGDASAHFPELAARDLSIAPYNENDPLLLSAIGGYWAALSGAPSSGVADTGGHEIAERNQTWARTAGELRRNDGWRTPWSAAFISWLMCEAGGAPFARSWAHRDYVDSAIAAADGGAPHLYHARAPDRAPAIGDLLCAHRAEYRADLNARREEPGALGDMHCDLVVAVNAAAVLAIGGNVENGVTLVRYEIARGLFRTRIRSFCAPNTLCRGADERLFALLVLQAPEEPAAALARARHLSVPPPRPAPVFAP